ncbi:hypothetical protein OROGR_024105 [Orobanche gracilis]
MEDGPTTIGFENGTIDVGRLLVEPQDGHVSVDGVMCFSEKIPEKAMDMEDFSRSFGITSTSIVREREDTPNRDVLDSVSSEVEVGYFRLHNDFCSIGEDYLLGVGFSDSITNMDYGSSEVLLTSVSDSSVLASNASPWKADLFGILEFPECQNHPLNNIDTSEFGEVPTLCHEPETISDQKPTGSPISCNLQDIGKFRDISSCSFQDVLSDTDFSSPPTKMFCIPKNEKNNEFGPTGQNGEPNRLRTMPTQANCIVEHTTQKRSRKPTQRYIDKLADPIWRCPKRKRDLSSSTIRDKSVWVKDHKKCRTGSRPMALPAEESSVVAIQVPFGSLVRKECPKSPAYDMNKEVRPSFKHACSSERDNPITKSEDNRVTTQNRKRRDEYTSLHVKKRDHSLTTASQKKSYLTVTAADVKKKEEQCLATPSLNKSNGSVLEASPRKKVDCPRTMAHQKRNDDCPAEESFEEISGRRKHHRLWTIVEVKKLIDGVSEYGVGRWSRIKKLLFSASVHRTSVDLKDKWRNLLKASRLQLGNQQGAKLICAELIQLTEKSKLPPGDLQGEKKRNLAWRPLPKSILHRVCDLDNTYPYPKGRKHRIMHVHHDTPDQSTDITLSDYRKILRSIS